MAEFTKEEQIQAIYDLKVGYTLGHADIAMLKAMARQLLASMEQTPVYLRPFGDDGETFVACDGNDERAIPLYAAPQLPQTSVVVSDEVIDTFEAEFRRAFEVSAGVEQLIEIGCQGEKFSLSIRDAATWWKLGRAAILKHSAPFIVTSDHRMMEMPQVEDINAVAAMLQGAEPVSQPSTLREALAAIRNLGPIDAEKIQAERDALNEPTCWCLACRPVTMNDPRFVVCPECGNKRCPHANDHRNACTGSNEPGQEGSAYPTAPQQEANNG